MTLNHLYCIYQTIADSKLCPETAEAIRQETQRLKAETAKLQQETERIKALNEELRLKRTGRYWAILNDVDSKLEALDGMDLMDTSEKIVFFKQFWPKPGCIPCRPSHEGPQKIQHRQYFGTDMWGNAPSPIDEVCRLTPHNGTCNKHWNRLLWFLTGHATSEPSTEDEEELDMFKYGYKDQSGKIVIHSAFIHNTANHIMSRCPYWMDKRQGYMVVPLMSFDAMLAWNGEPYKFIFIPTRHSVFSDVQSVTAKALSGMHAIASSDPSVKEGFDCMSHALRSLVNIMKGHQLTGKERGKAWKNFAAIVDWIRDLKVFLTPALPRAEVRFRLGSFSHSIRQTPGERAQPIGPQGHPAPSPWLLHARNANAWLTHLCSTDGGPRLDSEALGAAQVPVVKQPADCALFPAF